MQKKGKKKNVNSHLEVDVSFFSGIKICNYCKIGEEEEKEEEEEGEDKRIMVEEDETAGKTPEECRDLGLWEVDLVYYSLNGNNKVKIYHVRYE